ncbi:MAG: sensor histidine kinase [Chitinophagales bacterium]
MVNNLISSGKFLRPFLICWLIWIILHVTFIYWLGNSFIIALTDGLIFNVLLAGFCFFQLFIMQFYLPRNEKVSYIVVTGALIAFSVTFISRFFLLLLFRNENEYASHLITATPIRIVVAFLLSACMNMVNILIYTLEEQKLNVQRKHDAEQLTREAELYNLRSQLQPHFLFNSLNSISALAGSRPEEARKMIQQLSDFLRGTVRKDNAQFIALEEELRHLTLYLDIEKVRFGHRLKTEVITDEQINKMKIPSLLLQPVLENAIKFGLYDTLDEVRIKIRAESLNNELIVTVENPFDKQTHQPNKGTGFGLNAVQRRLFLLFSRSDLLTVASKNNIFTTTIKIPQPI